MKHTKPETDLARRLPALSPRVADGHLGVTWPDCPYLCARPPTSARGSASFRSSICPEPSASSAR